MLKRAANMFKALALVAVLSGCTTTAPVSGAGDIGYSNVGSSGPNRLYVCNGPKCGDLSVVVHRTVSISQSEIAAYEDLVNTPEGRRLIKNELSNLSRKKGDEITVSSVSKTKISGRDAAQFNLTFFEDGKRDAAGHALLIVEKGKLQFFAAINKSGARARAEVRQFAQKWAAGTK